MFYDLHNARNLSNLIMIELYAFFFQTFIANNSIINCDLRSISTDRGCIFWADAAFDSAGLWLGGARIDEECRERGNVE